MIYTKTGDDGTTSIIGGARLSKDHPRIEACGSIDELNAHIGLLVALSRPVNDNIASMLVAVQRHLFAVQTLLATDNKQRRDTLPQITVEHIKLLESDIDALQSSLPPLQSFIIPGGNMPAAQSHVARCVCRRAERRIATLNQQSPLPPELLAYVNRLSDLLFVVARVMAHSDGGTDTCISVGL